MNDNLTKEDIIKFYKYKRDFLFYDEWGFYFLLLFMYKYSYPYWIIFPILFYGGSAIYTSYSNLDKIEKYIVPIDQDVYIFTPSIVNFMKDIKSYFSMKRQSPFHKSHDE
jgi:hypothetical protein